MSELSPGIQRIGGNILAAQKRYDASPDAQLQAAASMPASSLRTLYVSGQLTLEELERLLDIVLRREVQCYV